MIKSYNVLSSRAGSVCSMDSFPVLSRASSRNMERDWDNGSIASSITSVEYNGEWKCSKELDLHLCFSAC